MILTTDYSEEFIQALITAGYKDEWTELGVQYIDFGTFSRNYGTANKMAWVYIKPEDAYAVLILPTTESKVKYLESIGIKSHIGDFSH